MNDSEGPRIGEVVSALSRFAPEALERIRELHPGYDLLFRRGEVLGSTPVEIACELTLEMLSRYGEAVADIQKKLRRRLRASRWFDLISKLAATGGAGGTLTAFLGQISPGHGLLAAAVALIGSSCGLLFSLLQRDESGSSLSGGYNRIIQALVEAAQQERVLRALCPSGKGSELKAALERANKLGKVLNELAIRYG